MHVRLYLRNPNPGPLSLLTSVLPHFLTSSLPHFLTSSLLHFLTSSLSHFLTSFFPSVRSLRYVCVCTCSCYLLCIIVLDVLSVDVPLPHPPTYIIYADPNPRPRNSTSKRPKQCFFATPTRTPGKTTLVCCTIQYNTYTIHTEFNINTSTSYRSRTQYNTIQYIPQGRQSWFARTYVCVHVVLCMYCNVLYCMYVCIIIVYDSYCI